MSNEDAILGRMRLAGVPPHAFPHSLKALKMAKLENDVFNKLYEKGVGGLVSYLITGGSKTTTASLVCSVMAKELVLQNRKVTCLSVSDLATLAENGEDAKGFSGKGYLVVSDVGSNTKNCSPFQWDVAQSTLLSHIARGGGIIIGSANFTEVSIGWEFIDALTLFTSIQIQK